MKRLFYILVGLMSLCVVLNMYSFYHHNLFWSPIAVFINVGTTVIAILYIIVAIIKKKQSRKKLRDEYDKFFGKN